MASYKSSLDIKINYNYWNICCVKVEELCPMWGEGEVRIPAGIKSLSE